eukprot:5733498-Amphidinium_carterae.1
MREDEPSYSKFFLGVRSGSERIFRHTGPWTTANWRRIPVLAEQQDCNAQTNDLGDVLSPGTTSEEYGHLSQSLLCQHHCLYSRGLLPRHCRIIIRLRIGGLVIHLSARACPTAPSSALFGTLVLPVALPIEVRYLLLGPDHPSGLDQNLLG